MAFNKKIIYYSIGAVFICFAITYLVIALLANSQLAAAQSAIAEAGYPTDARYFTPSPVGVDNNAALDYESANSLLEAGSWSTLSEDLTDDDHFTGEQLALIAPFLKQENTLKVITLLQAATEKTACQYLDNYSDGPNTEIPHISWSIHLFLNAAFYSFVFDGDYKQAQTMLQLNIAYCTRIYPEPFLICHLVNCKNYQNIFKQIRFLAELNALPNTDILADFDDQQLQHALIQCMHAERILFTEWFFDLSNHNENTTSFIHDMHSKGMACYSMTPLWTLDHAASLRLSLAIIDCMQAPYTGDRPELNLKAYNLISAQIIPGYYGSFQTTLSCRADLEITKAGIAYLQHKKIHGAFPASLDTLGQFIDPFTGTNLVYKSEATGPVIKSLGASLDPNDQDAPQWLIRVKQ